MLEASQPPVAARSQILDHNARQVITMIWLNHNHFYRAPTSGPLLYPGILLDHQGPEMVPLLCNYRTVYLFLKQACSFQHQLGSLATLEREKTSGGLR